MSFFRNVKTWFGFAHDDVPERPSTDEVATRRVSQLAALMKWLPNPDQVLQKTGKRIEHLKELTYDDEVFSSLQALHTGLQDVEYELAHDGTAQTQVELLETWMTAWDWDRIDNEIVQARSYGYQPYEIEWVDDGGMWRPADLVGKPPHWFRYSQDNHLMYLKQRAGEAQEVPGGKFVVARHKPSYNNPYGQAVLSRCWWPVVFKKGDLRFWITFAEKFGMPHAIGKHPRGADDDEINELLDQLQQMVQDAVAAIPDDSSVELLESPFKSSSSGVYKAIIDWAERTIQKVILSSEMTTSAGEHGTQALGGEQIEKVAGKVIGSTAKIKKRTIQQVIDWTWRFNGWPEDGKPTYRVQREEEADKDRAERDESLTRQGVRFTESYYQREYNLEEDDFIVSAPQATAPAGGGAPGFSHASGCQCPSCGDARFADADEEDGQAALEELLADLSSEDRADANQALMEDLLTEPMRIVMEADDEDEALAALASAYPDVDAGGFEDRLANLLFIAQTWGRIREQDEQTTDA